MMSTQFQQILNPYPALSTLAFTSMPPQMWESTKISILSGKMSAFIKNESPIQTLLFMKYTLSQKKLFSSEHHFGK